MRFAPPSSRPATIAFNVALACAFIGCAGSGPAPTPSPPGQGNVIVAEVASYQLLANRPGRLLLALLTGDNRWLSFGAVDMQFSYLGEGSGAPTPQAAPAPALARFLAIPGSPEGDGLQPTLTAPADGRGVYAAEPVTFPVAGFWQVAASGRLGDGSRFETSAAFTVRDRSTIPSMGDLAPLTENPIIGTPGVEPTAIDSRAAGSGVIPDAVLHRTSIAAAIRMGHPALVVFSTPVYCVSRFCGPVTDLVAELAARYGDRADFIHVEIYRDFEAALVNQAALDWLMTVDGELREPWTFLIDAQGRIAGSWDTVVTRSEIEPLLASLPVK
jgi:hypothetical protein